MALQGTLDTFSLPDVLRLLGATRKSGCLELVGQRGAGEAVEGWVWVDDGRVLAVVAGSPRPAAGGDLPSAMALFELLRCRNGSFTFVVDAEPAARNGSYSAGEGHPGIDGRDIEALVAEAESLLVEWQAIEAVVPSMGCPVTLRDRLDGGEVTFDGETWATLVAVARAGDVAGVGRALGLGELDTSRRIQSLVRLGVIEVGPAPAVASASAAGDAHAPSEPTSASEAAPSSPRSPWPSVDPDEGPSFLGRAVGDPAPAAPGVDDSLEDEAAREARAGQEPGPEVGDPAREGAVPPGVVPDAVPPGVVPDAVLAELSGPAARSVARLAVEPDGGHPDGGHPDGAAEDPLDRGMLLRFLSSVKH